MDVAFFGGSFNPPHVGHVLAASYARSVGFEQVVVVVVNQHAFAKDLLSFEHRVAMAELAFGELPAVCVSRIERDLPPPNYTLHTLRALLQQNPHWRLRLLLGTDVYADLPKWYESAEVQRLAPPFVLQRAGFTPPHSENAPSSPAAAAALQAPAILPAISSQEIRQQLAQHALSAHTQVSAESWLGQRVPRRVLDYIREHALYG